MSDILNFGDQLRIEGINCKGFGILPKYVMIDSDLTLEAKTIYAYFCSFAGNGNTTFPGRDKILSDLKISKDCYYKHFNLLIKQGYLSVDQQKENKNRFSKNIYTLVSNPKKFQDNPPEPSQNQLYSLIRFDGLKSAGYGVIPKAAMIDPRLPFKAKGIYAYFCSLTGSGNNAFPKKSQILYNLGISEKTYYKFYDVLTSLNYISVVQRHKDGKFQINDYLLCDSPDKSKACSKAIKIVLKQNCNIQDTEALQHSRIQDTVNEQYCKIQDTQNKDRKKQDRRNQDSNINSFNINNIKYKQSINHIGENQKKTNLSDGESENKKIIEFKNLFFCSTSEILDSQKLPYEYCQNKKLITEIVHWMTDWEVFYPNGYKSDLRQRVYNLFNYALIEMLTTKHTMTLNQSVTTYAKVVDRINELAEFGDSYVNLSEFMEPAMDNYIRGSEKSEIRNPTRYMMACIWGALQTGNIGMYEQLNRDGYGI